MKKIISLAAISIIPLTVNAQSLNVNVIGTFGELPYQSEDGSIGKYEAFMFKRGQLNTNDPSKLGEEINKQIYSKVYLEKNDLNKFKECLGKTVSVEGQMVKNIKGNPTNFDLRVNQMKCDDKIVDKNSTIDYKTRYAGWAANCFSVNQVIFDELKKTNLNKKALKQEQIMGTWAVTTTKISNLLGFDEKSTKEIVLNSYNELIKRQKSGDKEIVERTSGRCDQWLDTDDFVNKTFYKILKSS